MFRACRDAPFGLQLITLSLHWVACVFSGRGEVPICCGDSPGERREIGSACVRSAGRSGGPTFLRTVYWHDGSQRALRRDPNHVLDHAFTVERCSRVVEDLPLRQPANAGSRTRG